MGKIYVSYNNIISSLGFDSELVVDQVQMEISGLKRIDDRKILPQPFYSSMVDLDVLNQEFEILGNPSAFTKLEKMMILSVSKVIESSKVELTEKVGLIISTTKGNIDVLDTNSQFDKNRSYLDQLGQVVGDFFGIISKPIVVSNACVSGILAIAIAKRYIKQGRFDHVIVVGGDLVTEFILSGFNSFQALSEQPCKPYDKNRTGINIGEVTASVLVTNNPDYLCDSSVEILGEASCNDANHISGPSRTGEGLYRSLQSAMKQANIQSKEVDYISAHGTATLFNDEMEAIAFNRSNLQAVPTNSLKGYFGHTLGASGLLETVIGMHSLKNNTLYKSLGFETLGVTQPINIIESTNHKPLKTMIKTASGFGGCNTAVVFQKN